jgi:tRNA(Ile)-lysidine synthase
MLLNVSRQPVMETSGSSKDASDSAGFGSGTLFAAVADVLRRSGCRRLLVAFSGGLDSCALARVLDELAPAEGWSIELAYFNHRLRGGESDQEEAFCRAFAERLGRSLHVGRWAEPEPGEAAARQARYRWLLETARAGGHDAVLTAHHRQDQAETVLLRLVRGTGVDGLQAMAEVGPFPGAGGCVALVRPLLGVPRPVLRRYAENVGLAWFEDSSNRSEAFLRNRIRQRLLPLLEELRPGAERRLARLAAQAREECRALDVLLAEALQGRLVAGPGWALLPREILRGEPAVARRSVAQALRALDGAARSVKRGPIEALLQAAVGPQTRQRRFELGAGIAVLLLADALAVLRGPPWLPRPQQLLRPLPAGHPDLERLLDVEVCAPQEAGPLRVRTRRPGDRLGPGRGSLKELFIERGLPRFLRDRYPLVEDDSGLLLVPGLWLRPDGLCPRVRFGPSWPGPLLPPELNR